MGHKFIPKTATSTRNSFLGCDRELKHARFSDANGDRKRTFRVPGQWCPPEFYNNHP